MATETREQKQNNDNGRIRPDERDYNLLHPQWPSKPLRFEKRVVHGPAAETYLYRTFQWWLFRKPHNTAASAAADKRKSETVTRSPLKKLKLFEAIVRFPSAPVYSTHRKRDYQYTMPERVNYHTMRVLRRPPEEGRNPSRIGRIYLLHNGLNENDNIAFYYDLAARLLDEDPTAACILRPFPGHLSRHPFPAHYAEMPLDRYLLDAGDLFRQFLRFMVEAQWLLSILVPCRSYRVVAGLDLLAEGDSKHEGRNDPAVLARAITTSWADAFRANDRKEQLGKRVTRNDMLGVIKVIRHLLGWKAGHDDPDRSSPASKVDLVPFVHAVGYSLGGFLAQSVFFTWPFAISSCTTICSGGTLRDVALTAFASPEEWQTVMHALRYEMQSAMLERRIKQEGGLVAGIAVHVFSSLHRVFHAVFLQDFRGSYSSRVSEYIARLFFVVGGKDPIVSIRAVLDASPREGVNLVEVANLSHFPLHGDVEWQDFWLPEVAGVMAHFATRTEDLLLTTLKENWWNKERTKWLRKGGWTNTDNEHSSGRKLRMPGDAPIAGRQADPDTGNENSAGNKRRRAEHAPIARRQADPDTGNEGLSSAEFQLDLTAMVDLLPEGWLFISRNDVPSALLGPRLLHRRGTALHHSDAAIRRYVSGLNQRRERMTAVGTRSRITLILPEPLKRWFSRKQPALSGKSEAAASQVPSDTELAAIWSDFSRAWAGTGSLRLFSPNSKADPEQLDRAIRSSPGGNAPDYPVLNTLPDAWIALDSRALTVIAGGISPDRKHCEAAFVEWASKLHEKDEQSKTLLEEWLLTEWLRVVKVSAAEFNPRFMGWRIRDPRRAAVLVVHTALGYTHSSLA